MEIVFDLRVNVAYLLKSIWTQLLIWPSVSFPFPSGLSMAFALFVFRPLSEQFGLNVASSMAIVESKLLHVKRISESWHPHSSTTSAKNKNNQIVYELELINKSVKFGIV